ncbi:MAG: hypothetical protein ACYC6N_17340 [Pirellulaceae bacterium]
MKKSDQYHKWIEWSDEDGAYIGLQMMQLCGLVAQGALVGRGGIRAVAASRAEHIGTDLHASLLGTIGQVQASADEHMVVALIGRDVDGPGLVGGTGDRQRVELDPQRIGVGGPLRVMRGPFQDVGQLVQHRGQEDVLDIVGMMSFPNGVCIDHHRRAAAPVVLQVLADKQVEA